MRSGLRVRVTGGEHAGRIGVIQAVSIDGAAVRMLSTMNGFPFTEVKVISLADLERAPSLRRPRGGPAVMEAPF
jgi:hypothetical protein